jgi:exopolyphosphatase/guanosine-5'-triphosphate,3'-diphosphate pyrophosphatase
MRRAAVDIGTNSMRLLVVDDEGGELARLTRVTGLGRGVDRIGRLSEEGMAGTLAVLAGFASRVRELRVDRVRAVATSASRDAANREDFFDRAEQALGVRPEVIGGDEEAALSFAGATNALDGGPFLVVDIGGGSTEFAWRSAGRLVSRSVEIGSVRLTERALPNHPPWPGELEQAGRLAANLFGDVSIPDSAFAAIGVAGTWTSLAALAGETAAVHGSRLDQPALDHLVDDLAALTLEETAALPFFDPARAPVILGGAVVAAAATRRLGVEVVTVSEYDLLDGVVARL